MNDGELQKLLDAEPPVSIKFGLDVGKDSGKKPNGVNIR
jgi:hypothetical protein